ncbi:acyltransferase family protein [Crenobacter cavernae]|nr:acyltransferase family protein [Crenobacter cavernae]
MLVSCLMGYALFATDFLGVDRSALSGWIQAYGDFDFTLPGALAEGLWRAFLLADSSYNWPLWTMKIELYGSLLVFAVCCVLPWLRFRRSFLALFGAALVYSRPESEGLLYALFLLGVALSLDEWTLPTPLAVALAALGIYASAFNEGNHLHALFDDVHLSLNGAELSREYLFNAIGGASLAVAVLHHPRCSRWFSDPWLVKLGELSFGAYLVHMLVLASFGAWLFDFVLPRAGYVAAGMVGLVSSVVVIYALAHPYARHVDQTSVRWSNRLVKRLLHQPAGSPELAEARPTFPVNTRT